MRPVFGRFVRFVPVVASLLTLPALAHAQGGQGRGGTQIQPEEQCPPGMTEVRPRNCQAPTMPAPSIVDYRPRPSYKANFLALYRRLQPDGTFAQPTAAGAAKAAPKPAASPR